MEQTKLSPQSHITLNYPAFSRHCRERGHISYIFLCHSLLNLFSHASRVHFNISSLNLRCLFALYGRVAFHCVAKEKVPKERTPCRVGLRLLCALQLSAATAELAALGWSSR